MHSFQDQFLKLDCSLYCEQHANASMCETLSQQGILCGDLTQPENETPGLFFKSSMKVTYGT